MTSDLAAILIRVVLAAIFCAQGYLKTFGAKDRPHGHDASVHLISRRGLQRAQELATALGVSELAFGALVGIGLFTREAAAPLALILVMAIVGFKFRGGFVGGWDWPFAVLGLVVAAELLGGGKYSFDALIGWSF